MEKSINFENFINKHFKISIAFFAIGLFFAIAYSLNLLGFVIDSQGSVQYSVSSSDKS
ncbi:hypothetical protein [Aliarcobacter cryaerophilus]|uniref:hypothetical protein n=1 Tax=Aliarcobacter cryaerophilus TaxID=28198 RepID=UPI0021B28F1F|nr:hypothetical protein [Aliarcobacter cryaerophilus]MCT7499364.1 hypothetical protein [Aliarcobacter cryaerophilus]MCT7543210.1 hypothetical protein [Aliarcobacter cryaerophilus]